MSVRTQKPLFVGRKAELGELEDLLRVVREGMGKVVLISAEPGGGKTALARQFIDKHPECHTGAGECTDKLGLAEYQPFKQILAELNADYLTEDPQKRSQIKGKVIEFIKDAGPAWIGAIPVIGGVASAGLETLKAAEKQFGTTSSNDVKNASDIQNLYEQELRWLSQNNPLIMLIDDLQWSDPSSINLLFRLGKTIRNNPFKIMIIGTYRPHDINQSGEYYFHGQQIDKHPFKIMLNELRGYTRKEAHIENSDWLREIDLQAMGEREVSEIIAGRFPENDFPLDFSQKLEQHTEGNPLFITELLESIAESEGISQNSKGVFVLDKEVLEELPSSVQGVISARIDRLKETMRKILECASVGGDRFAAQVVEKITAMDELELAEHLDELAAKHGLINHESMQMVRETFLDLYKFTHVLIQKYVYEGVSESRRRIIHKKFAQSLKLIYGDDMETRPKIQDEFDRHLEIAMGHRNGITLQLTDKKASNDEISNILDFAETDIEKARDLLAQFALDECLNVIDEAQAILDKLPAIDVRALNLQFKIHTVRGGVLEKLGRFKETLDAGNKMLDIANKTGDRRQLADAHFKIAAGLHRLGQLQGSVDNYQKAIEIYNELGDKKSLADMYSYIGDTYRFMGKAKEALDSFFEAEKLIDPIKDRYSLWRLYHNIGILYSSTHRTDEAMEYLIKSRDIAIEQGYKYPLSANYYLMGLVADQSGDSDKSIEYLEKAKEIKESLNDRAGLARIYDFMGTIYLAEGDREKAMEYANISVKFWREIEDNVGYAIAMGNKARVLNKLGRYREALEHDLVTLETFKKLQIPQNIGQALINVGADYVDIGEYDNALEVHKEAREIYEKLGHVYGIYLANTNIGGTYNHKEEPELALPALEISQDAALKLNFTQGILGNHIEFGKAYMMLGDNEKALDSFNKVIETAKQVGYTQSEIFGEFYIGVLGMQTGVPDAASRIEKAVEYWKTNGINRYIKEQAESGKYPDEVKKMLRELF